MAARHRQTLQTGHKYLPGLVGFRGRAPELSSSRGVTVVQQCEGTRRPRDVIQRSTPQVIHEMQCNAILVAQRIARQQGGWHR